MESHNLLQEVIRLKNELMTQKYEIEKLKTRVKELEEFQYQAQVLEGLEQYP